MNSRESEGVTRRRRECNGCNKRFTTYERVEIDLMGVKNDGKREQFDREKVYKGIRKACEKRPISSDIINGIVNELEGSLRANDSNEIPSNMIGRLIMKKLKVMDNVAYIRFASVYRNFADVEDFEKELKKLRGGNYARTNIKN
jgi:transcriptional repressor NrdR